MPNLERTQLSWKSMELQRKRSYVSVWDIPLFVKIPGLLRVIGSKKVAEACNIKFACASLTRVLVTRRTSFLKHRPRNIDFCLRNPQIVAALVGANSARSFQEKHFWQKKQWKKWNCSTICSPKRNETLAIYKTLQSNWAAFIWTVLKIAFGVQNPMKTRLTRDLVVDETLWNFTY